MLERGLPAAPSIRPGDDFVKGGLGGIDDCLPGIAAELEQVGRPAVPDHGEVWSRPIELVAVTATSATTIQEAVDGRYTFRRIFDVADATLTVRYELVNTSAVAVSVVWAAHPLLPLTRMTELELGAIVRLRVYSGSLAAAGVELGLECGLTRPGTLPEGTTLKAFASLPHGTELRVRYPDRRRSLLLRLDADQPAWLGLWLNAAGFPREHPVSHLALEPSFGDSDALSDAVASGTCLTVAPGGRAEWALAYSVEPA
jgi:galactose mutarotase-like enzyme